MPERYDIHDAFGVAIGIICIVAVVVAIYYFRYTTDEAVGDITFREYLVQDIAVIRICRRMCRGFGLCSDGKAGGNAGGKTSTEPLAELGTEAVRVSLEDE